MSRERDNAERLLRDFQSRDVERRIERPWEDALTGLPLYKVGTADRTDYRSDKDDPETREPSKRRTDPDGVQGIWKYFTHKHSGGVGFYTTAENYAKIYPSLYGRRGLKDLHLPSQVIEQYKWPENMVYLSVLAQVEIDLPDGQHIVFKPKSKLHLYAFPDTHTLVAWRDPNKHTTPGDEIYLWRGGILHVTWRGIQG